MPQATRELRALMQKWFGDPIFDFGPDQFLRSHGFTVDKTGVWRPPVPYHNVSREELACLRFLREEWDYDYAIAGYYPEYPNGRQWEAVNV